MPGKNPYPKTRLIMSVIADESTVTGFLLTGMGQRDNNGKTNYYMSSKETTDEELEAALQAYLEDPKIAIVFIAQNLAERVRNVINEHLNDEEKILPTIMEIPSKEAEYDPTKDSMLVQAATKLFGSEAGMAQLLDDKNL